MSAAGGPDYRQAALVLLAILGLVVAAFAAPALSGQAGGGGGGDLGDGKEASPNGEGGGGDGGGGDAIGDLLRRILEAFDGSDGERDPSPRTDPACRIFLDSKPVPGDDLTVTVISDGEPVTDALVWFNDRRVGRTDERGRVTGEVPYSRDLRIRVEAPSLSGCSATVGGVGGSLLLGAAPPAPGPVPNGTGGATAGDGATTLAAGQQADAAGPDETVTVTVAGQVIIDVVGDPYPGETVTVRAAVEGVPMREATVTVDGEAVATTDDRGQAEVRIPEGTRRVTVTVSRGDFSGRERIDVLLLEASLRPSGAVLAPGDSATLVATIDEEPVSGAVVRVDGERVGTTGPEGELPVVLPVDPTAEITVATERQETSVSLLGLYWLPLSLLALAVTVLAWLASRWKGRAGAAAVVGLAASLVGILLVDAYLGPLASRLAVGALLALLLGAALVHRRRRVAGAATTSAGLLARFLEWVARTARRVVSLGEVLWGWLTGAARTVAAWVRSLPTSLSGLLRRLLDGVVTFARWVGTLVRDPPLTLRSVAVVVGAVAALAGGYHLDEVRGLLLVGLGLVLAGVAWWLHRREAGASSGAGGDAAAGTTAAEAGSAPAVPDAGVEEWSLRQLWRAFAAVVVPGGWRTRTPVEVARTAVEKGYPEGPVRDLTRTFRAVEYGHRPQTDPLRERAREAYDALLGTDEDPGEAGGSDRPGDGGSDHSGDDGSDWPGAGGSDRSGEGGSEHSEDGGSSDRRADGDGSPQADGDAGESADGSAAREATDDERGESS